MPSSPQKGPLLSSCCYQTRTVLPSNLTVCEGQTVSLMVAQEIWPQPCIQWQVSSDQGCSWTDLRRKNQSSLSFIAMRQQDGNLYRALVRTKCDCWVTNALKLTVNYIDIIQPPVSQESLVGGSVTFTAEAVGKPPITSISWECSTDRGKTWTVLPGANSNSLTLTDVQASQCGNLYRAVFRNGCVERSNPAELIIVRTLAYVANSFNGAGGNSISVINTETNSNIKTIPVGSEPFGVAITPNGRYAYVTNFSNNSVSVIDTATNTIIDTITVGSNPIGVAITPDGRFAYVTNFINNSVSVINTETNTVITTISGFFNPRGVAITPDGRFAYVTNLVSGTVSVINTATNTVIDTITVGTNPVEVAITPDGRFAYVTNRNSSDVSVIKTATNTVIATIGGFSNPNGVAITPDGRFAYVTNSGSNSVTVINTATNTIFGAAIPVGLNPQGVAITPDGRFAYVANAGSNTVSVIRTSDNTVVGAPIPVGIGPFGIAIGNIPIC